MRRAISTDADKPVEQRHSASHFARVARVLSYECRDLNARSLKDWQHRIQSRQASTSATVWVHDEVHAPRLERSSRKNQQRLQEGSANCKHLLAAARPRCWCRSWRSPIPVSANLAANGARIVADESGKVSFSVDYRGGDYSCETRTRPSAYTNGWSSKG